MWVPSVLSGRFISTAHLTPEAWVLQKDTSNHSRIVWRKRKGFSKRSVRMRFSQELGGGVRIDREMWQKGNASANAGQTMNAAGYGSASAPMDNLVLSDDEDIMTLRLSASFKSMNLVPRRRARFFGKSSGVILIQKAIGLKKEATVGTRRENDRGTRDTFPDNGLGLGLVHLYFVHINPLSPFLHRPSFERQVRQGVHSRNSSFGAVYLLVGACALRYSDDTRVFLDFVESGIHEHSAGWKYFEQVQMVRRTLLGPPCSEDLQTYNACLSVQFLQGTSAPQACWTIVGIGIRLAQDVGAHRRKSYNEKNSVEGELWKRTFWSLVLFDRQMSSSLGRPCAIQDEDFDLDYPIECDDEYWEHPDPEQAFKQPPDKPSTVSYFVSFIKLNNILSFAHRTIYSINKSKILLGFVGPQWEQHIVAELDSSLNKWIDEVPDHREQRSLHSPLLG
ncbi:hypothetical protein JVU11DRAFT_12476 [Chiua virens]|nr:hypothetical protein JVU11DRAFT_12476 [Chiua virens]